MFRVDDDKNHERPFIWGDRVEWREGVTHFVGQVCLAPNGCDTEVQRQEYVEVKLVNGESRARESPPYVLLVPWSSMVIV